MKTILLVCIMNVISSLETIDVDTRNKTIWQGTLKHNVSKYSRIFVEAKLLFDNIN